MQSQPPLENRKQRSLSLPTAAPSMTKLPYSVGYLETELHYLPRSVLKWQFPAEMLSEVVDLPLAQASEPLAAALGSAVVVPE